MPLTRRYEPPHPSGEQSVFGMDFSAVVPAGVALASGTLRIFSNTQPPIAADADWTVEQPLYIRGRAMFQGLTGGIPGKDYMLQWSTTDSRNNIWYRTGLLLCAPTS